MKGEKNLQDIIEGWINLEAEDEEIELIWKKIRKHHQILEKMASVLEELSEELDEIKGNWEKSSRLKRNIKSLAGLSD